MLSANAALKSFLVAVFIFAPASSARGQTTQPVALPVRCEYATDSPTPGSREIAFPDGDFFRPLLAGPKEPRSSFTLMKVKVLDDGDPTTTEASDYTAGDIAVGGVVGMWAHATSACSGIQVNLIGGVFSQFNLDAYSKDLTNTDFIVGTQISMRSGGLSGRVRIYHQSSHLGDDYLLHNPTEGDINFGFQAIDGLVSFDREWWRVYGGTGYLIFQNDEGHSVLAQGGAEFRSRRKLKIFRPVAGIDLLSLQKRSWGLTTSASAGFEWTSPAETRRLRGMIVFHNGYSPFGQFAIQQQSRAIGLQLQIEF